MYRIAIYTFTKVPSLPMFSFLKKIPLYQLSISEFTPSHGSKLKSPKKQRKSRLNVGPARIKPKTNRLSRYTLRSFAAEPEARASLDTALGPNPIPKQSAEKESRLLLSATACAHTHKVSRKERASAQHCASLGERKRKRRAKDRCSNPVSCCSLSLSKKKKIWPGQNGRKSKLAKLALSRLRITGTFSHSAA